MKDDQGKIVNVVAGVVIWNEKILCVQKGAHKYEYISYKYEFPGGKVESSETKEAALIREIREELQLEIQVVQQLPVVDHQYPDFRIFLQSFVCTAANNKISLTEHIAYQWLAATELLQLDWAAADIPVVQKLQQLSMIDIFH
ncbi:(deoxy)nucleoside triphosphate pyrophosphohydrolase [Flavitalea sp.]|nr:(deoxy)nucleoside triphosphate pyrophosphohydrolase [Flavitalea sp.]